MKGLILNRGESGYSYLGEVFFRVKELSEKYNWLVSFPECYPQSEEWMEKMNTDSIWMTGQELKKLLTEDDFQWIWGELSGFPKSVSFKDILKFPLPHAEGYAGFWKNPLTLQHPLAEVELVAWDSSCTLFLSSNETVIEQIAHIYPQAEDLESYNKE